MQTMDKFSHDLSRALEETSKCVKVGRWGRRRTLSTGNLPCAPQPTEDSSSSPTDAPNEPQSNHNPDGLNSIHSDSDDRIDLRLSFQKSRHVGNFESDSLNENFSPARFFRPNTRRKRKFKRMAVEYETTPSTPGTGIAEVLSAGALAAASGVDDFTSNETNTVDDDNPIIGNLSSGNGNSSGAIKKRVLKCPENYRTNLFFCGKRKRSHRDRYDHHEYYGGKLHSSSVPRQSYIYAHKNTSYADHKQRTRSFSSTSKPNLDKILPLNKGLISKIEKISQQQVQSESIAVELNKSTSAFTFKPIAPESSLNKSLTETPPTPPKLELKFESQILPARAPNPAIPTSTTTKHLSQIPENVAVSQQSDKKHLKSERSGRRKKNHRLRREQIRAQLQFDDPHSMECTAASTFNDFLSSSSLSSSDSEADETNESDREGDDELTDWPGNEAMINFASKNDFKRRVTKKLPQIKSDDYLDDTLMSADEVLSPAPIQLKSSTLNQIIPSQPIDISGAGLNINATKFVSSSSGGPFASSGNSAFRFPVKQIESEMSGETSNPFLASPPCQMDEIREIRAGCRRIKDERPGFCIKTSVNERLARFLQDARQNYIRLPDMELSEHDALVNLAKLYSLHMVVDNVGCTVLTKTSNTTQSVKVDQHQFNNRFFLSDFKRRCYDDRNSSIGSSIGSIISCSADTNDSLIDCINNELEDEEIIRTGLLQTSTSTTSQQHMTS